VTKTVALYCVILNITAGFETLSYIKLGGPC